MHTCCSVSNAPAGSLSHWSSICEWARTPLSFFLSFSALHNTCEFYCSGRGFRRFLDLSNRPQQAVKNQALNLPRRQGQSVEKWEWRLEFNYSLKALRVQYESEGWDINLQGCLCLYNGYNKKITQNPWNRTQESVEKQFKVWWMSSRTLTDWHSFTAALPD